MDCSPYCQWYFTTGALLHGARMDRFIARENIKHFRERLWSESDPDVRSRLQKLLTAELDRLAKDHELLADIDHHISDGNHRIGRQREVVSGIERDGRDGLSAAQALLNGLVETQLLITRYRERNSNGNLGKSPLTSLDKGRAIGVLIPIPANGSATHRSAPCLLH
jgi:hypothetical protein